MSIPQLRRAARAVDADLAETRARLDGLEPGYDDDRIVALQAVEAAQLALRTLLQARLNAFESLSTTT